jgi:hypothetical protein
MKYLAFNPCTGEPFDTDCAVLSAINYGTKDIDFLEAVGPRIQLENDENDIKRNNFYDNNYNESYEETYLDDGILSSLKKSLKIVHMRNSNINNLETFEISDIQDYLEISYPARRILEAMIELWLYENIKYVQDEYNFEENFSVSFPVFFERLKYVLNICEYIDLWCHKNWGGEKLRNKFKKPLIEFFQKSAFWTKINKLYNEYIQSLFENVNNLQLNRLEKILYFLSYIPYLLKNLEIEEDCDFEINLNLKLDRTSFLLCLNAISTKLNYMDLKKDIYYYRRNFLSSIVDNMLTQTSFYETVCIDNIGEDREYVIDLVHSINYIPTKKVVDGIREFFLNAMTELAFVQNYPPALVNAFEFLKDDLKIYIKILVNEEYCEKYWKLYEHLAKQSTDDCALSNHIDGLKIFLPKESTDKLFNYVCEKFQLYFCENLLKYEKFEEMTKYGYYCLEFLSDTGLKQYSLERIAKYARDMIDIFREEDDDGFFVINPIYHPSGSQVLIKKNKRLNLPLTIQKEIKTLLKSLKTPEKEFKFNHNYEYVVMNINLEDEKVIHLTCSSFIATILMAFEDIDEIDYNELQSLVGMTGNHFEETINKLVNTGLLERKNNNTTLAFNSIDTKSLSKKKEIFLF